MGGTRLHCDGIGYLSQLQLDVELYGLSYGEPIGMEYSESSNVDNAHRLEGKLLLVVGELDQNVDPSSTMQVVHRLIKQNKNFDLLVIPGAGHGPGAYGEHKRFDFFTSHLLGVHPPDWKALEDRMKPSTPATDGSAR